MAQKSLSQLIKTRKAIVGIVGLGYVGLPSAIAVAQSGFSAIGIDINKQRSGERFIPFVDIRNAIGKKIKRLLSNG